MADQSQTPEATPRPWRMWGMQLRASTCPERCADYDHSILLADFYTERDGHLRTFDLDLTITAVNAYDRLRRIEAAARDLIDLHDGDEHTDETWPCDGRCLQARALRAALEEKP